MTDLTHYGSLTFWQHYKDSSVYQVVTFMESMEDWTVDDQPHEVFEQAVAALGAALEQAGKVDLKKEADIIGIAAYIKTSRMLHLLHCLDSAHPGAASQLFHTAENHAGSHDDAPALFLKRNIVFERLRLLKRMFSEPRFALVQSALEDAHVD